MGSVTESVTTAGGRSVSSEEKYIYGAPYFVA